MAGEWAEEPHGTWNAEEGAGSWAIVTDELGQVFYRNSVTGAHSGLPCGADASV